MEEKAMRKACFLLAFLFPILCFPKDASAQSASPQPDPANFAASARWLVAKNAWGVLSTISADLGGAPFGNVVSYSDGEPGHGFGVPYFYLAKLEPEGSALKNGTRAALTVSENPLGTCTTDIQDPKCKGATLGGQLQLISLDNPEVKLAQVALFTKHPQLQGFPTNQNFEIYKLVLEYVYLVNDFGNPKYLTPQAYLDAPPM